MTRRNQPGSAALAAMWAQIPAARQRSIVREIQDSLREVTNAGSINTVHEPFTGSHSHSHHAYGSQGNDACHSHEHSHDGDANHNHHEHAEASARTRRPMGSRVPVMNQARRARTDAAWARALKDAQEL